MKFKLRIKIFFLNALVLLLVLACKKNTINPNVNDNSTELEKEEVQMAEFPKNLFQRDSSLTRHDAPNVLRLNSGKNERNLMALCQCEKDVDNQIYVQIISAIPTASELAQGIQDEGRVFKGRLHPLKSFSGQLKFLTFQLQDDTTRKIQLVSKSSELEYNDSDFKYSEVIDYQIQISTFDYSVASQVYGKFEVVLNEEFGYFQNDTILKGTFECFNARIQKLEEIKNWDIEVWNKKRKENWGFKIDMP